MCYVNDVTSLLASVCQRAENALQVKVGRKRGANGCGTHQQKNCTWASLTYETPNLLLNGHKSYWCKYYFAVSQCVKLHAPKSLIRPSLTVSLFTEDVGHSTSNPRQYSAIPASKYSGYERTYSNTLITNTIRHAVRNVYVWWLFVPRSYLPSYAKPQGPYGFTALFY